MQFNFNKRTIWAALAAVTLVSSVSCEKNENPGSHGTTGEGQFVIAAHPTAEGMEGVADYLFTTPNLEEGKLSTEGDGIEQDGSYRYYTTSGTKFYSLLYGQGNPGAVTVYDLNEYGGLHKLTNFVSENAHAFAPVNDDILLIKSARSYTSPTAQWFRVGTETNTIVGEGTYDAVKLAGNGELAHPSWITQVGNKVYMPYFCIRATADMGWTTSYPDSSWIAVFSYPAMELEKIIKDNRTSSIGVYYENGLAVTENGDIYGYSPANTVEKVGTEEIFNGTKPSAIVRIKAGTTEFDDYYYNMEEASSGYYVSAWDYVGDGLALAFMNKVSEKSQWTAIKKLAIVDLPNKQFTWVTGTPNEDNVVEISSVNHVDQSGNIFVGISTNDGKSFVYKVNSKNTTATKGLEMEGGTITSISWLPAKN
jgi:hypothetical protein